MNAIDAARAFVDKYFPRCSVAFLAGSVSRGEGTNTSDLDIVIFDERNEPYTKLIVEFDWPIQAYALPQLLYEGYLEGDAHKGRPSLLSMCFEGIIIKDQDETAQKIKAWAGKKLADGPRSLEPNEVDELRYQIAELLDDFADSNTFEEGMFIATDLVQVASYLLLRHNRKWTGKGKWLVRALSQFDKDWSEQIISALRTFYQTGAKVELMKVGNEILDLVGGRFHTTS